MRKNILVVYMFGALIVHAFMEKVKSHWHNSGLSDYKEANTKGLFGSSLLNFS